MNASGAAPELNLHNNVTANNNVRVRDQVKFVFRDMARSTWSSAKSLGKVAGIFSAFECAIESYRAMHDYKNPIMAGCATGGVLAAKAGPKAVAMGCVGFAAFSAAVEYVLNER